MYTNEQIVQAMGHLETIVERNRAWLEDQRETSEDTSHHLTHISRSNQRNRIVEMIQNDNGEELTHEEAVTIYEIITSELI